MTTIIYILNKVFSSIGTINDGHRKEANLSWIEAGIGEGLNIGVWKLIFHVEETLDRGLVVATEYAEDSIGKEKEADRRGFLL